MSQQVYNLLPPENNSNAGHSYQAFNQNNASFPQEVPVTIQHENFMPMPQFGSPNGMPNVASMESIAVMTKIEKLDNLLKQDRYLCYKFWIWFRLLIYCINILILLINLSKVRDLALIRFLEEALGIFAAILVLD